MDGPKPAWPMEKKNPSTLSQNQPSPATKLTGGGLFSPSHPPVCGTQVTKENNEREEGLPGAEGAVPGWSDCFAGGAAVEAGGVVMAYGRRLPAVV